MLNLGSITRRNDVHSLWSVIGDIWEKVRLNDYSSKFIESLWLGNSLLSEERLNVLLNTYDRLCQRYYQAYKGMIRLSDFTQKIIKRNRIDGFNLEYKFFFKEIDSDVRYMYSPRFLTNDFRPPDLTDYIFKGMVYRTYPNLNKLVVIEDFVSDDLSQGLINHIFIDSNNIPFIITGINKGEIFYKRIYNSTNPVEGEFKVTPKIELENGVDYLTEIEDDFLIFRFKDFSIINPSGALETFFSSEKNYLYGFDIPYIDSFCEVNFGYPVGLNDSDIKAMYNSGLSWPEINQIILDLWKIDQRVYGFDQIYRMAALFSGKEFTRILGNKLFLFFNDYPNKRVYLAENKNYIKTELITKNLIPGDIRITYNVEGTDDACVLKILSSPINPIEINDPIILDKEAYYIKQNIDDVYLILDRNVSNHPMVNIVNQLDKNKIKVYPLDDYGLFELNTFVELPNGDFSNLSDILDVTNTVRWGDFPWGTFNFGELFWQQIYSGCRFKPLEVGDEFQFGDCFQPYILPNFYFTYEKDTSETELRHYLNNNATQTDVPIVLQDPNKIVPRYYIQKALALENKEFTENNFLEYQLNKTLLILPFFNYSNKLDIKENDLFAEDTEWDLSSGITHEYNRTENYGYTSIITDDSVDPQNIHHEVDLFTDNKTGKSILRLFIKLNSGKVKIGIGSSTPFFNESAVDKFIFKEVKIAENEIPKWEYVNILIDNSIFSDLQTHYIFIEPSDMAKFDVFGVQMYTTIPSYFEKLFLNKSVLDKYISSYNYKLINLL